MSASSHTVELYTSHQPCNAQGMEYKGLVVVNKATTKNIVADCGTAIRSCFGGEMKNLSRLSENTRNELLEQAATQARALGANAIIGLSFQTNTIFEGSLDMVVSGTAVKVMK